MTGAKHVDHCANEIGPWSKMPFLYSARVLIIFLWLSGCLMNWGTLTPSIVW
jgi:hypothetical protein